MNLDEIKELIQVVKDTGVAELEVQRGDSRVRIKAADVAGAQEVRLAPAPVVVAQTGGSALPHVSAPAAPVNAPPPASAEANLVAVKSPIVGTFYESPSPGSAAFVKVGDTVSAGQVLCIIESMKLMNEIESEVSGVIVAKLVDNGKPVEYGEALFTVRPQ